MTNLDLVNLVFDQIKSMGFKIKDITHPDGYFIFEGEKDSVTHFRLSGHGMWKKWKFGLWVHSEYTTEEKLEELKQKREAGKLKWGEEPKVIQLFAQYETNIDKFKPSASSLLVEYDAEHVIDVLNNKYKYPWCQMESMLKMMYKHPFMCYDGFCGEYAGYRGESFFWNFIKYETEDKIRNLREALNIAFWYPYTKIKCYFARKDKCIHSLEIYDFEKENPGWSTSYLYEIRITFTEAATEDEECKWLNKWFHKRKYGKYGYFDNVISIDSFRKVGMDERFTYDFED